MHSYIPPIKSTTIILYQMKKSLKRKKTMKIALLLVFTLCVVAASPPLSIGGCVDLGVSRRQRDDFWQKWMTTEAGNLKKEAVNEGRVFCG
jgi:hypothetical protein